MSESNGSVPTTVEPLVVGTMRIVEGVALRDPTELGEEVARFPPGSAMGDVHAELVRLASANRGVDYSVDVVNSLGFSPLWQRFLSACYEPEWIVEPRTGIIESKPEQLAKRSVADHVAVERAKFDGARAKAKAKHARAAGRSQPKAAKTATNH